MTAVERPSSSERVGPFALAVRARRKELGLSQADLASRLGVQTQTISQWERTDKKPQPRFYDKLVDLLNLGDREELRELIGVSGHGTAGTDRSKADRAGRDRAKQEHLSLVRDAQSVRSAPSGSSWDREDDEPTDPVVAAALKIINARNGRLSEVEAEIVRELMTSRRRGHTSR